MRGRKPIPTNLRLLHGNPARKPLPKSEPKPARALPRPPKTISPRAKEHWRPLARQLDEVGVLTCLDATALLLLCETYATWEEAGEELREHGLVITKPSGLSRQSPYLLIANRAQDQLLKLLTEFGMTPIARTRVAMRKDGQVKDPVAEDLFGA